MASMMLAMKVDGQAIEALGRAQGFLDTASKELRNQKGMARSCDQMLQDNEAKCEIAVRSLLDKASSVIAAPTSGLRVAVYVLGGCVKGCSKLIEHRLPEMREAT